MKIVFFSPKPFSKRLGATKNRIELAQSLKKLGWETYLVESPEIMSAYEGNEKLSYKEALKQYLIENAHNYDVVLYEYDSLPFSRDLFCHKTLFIARPALLFFSDTEINDPVDLKTRLSIMYNKFKNFLKFNSYPENNKQDLEKTISLNQCDVIQVQNSSDADLLINRGFNENKIIIVPNGISDKRKAKFEKSRSNGYEQFSIAYVGTFDFRKGAMDFPYIVKTLTKHHPNCKFKLMGTRGLFVTADQVLNFFPKKLRHSIEVIPTFEPKHLPELLTDCQIGVFPSYLESFGFGALEMMCAGLPVVGYNAPGPSDFILKELLVPIGDKKSLVVKILNLMEDKVKLLRMSQEAKEVTNRYSWRTIALTTSEIYKEKYNNLNARQKQVKAKV